MRRIVCLCATYGRKAHLLETSIECFLRQNYENKHLLICDDTKRAIKLDGYEDVTILNVDRVHLSKKYEMMCEYASENLEPEIFAVWDDDDLYLPNHLPNMEKALRNNEWCCPSQSYFFSGKLHTKNSKWHATMGLTTKAHGESGWRMDESKHFDTNLVHRLQKVYGKPADSFVDRPSFVYRWSNTGNGRHSSGHLDPKGHKNYKPQNTDDLVLSPRLDAKAEELEHLFDAV